MVYSLPIDYSDGTNDGTTDSATYTAGQQYPMALQISPNNQTMANSPDSYMEIGGDGMTFTILTAFLNGWPVPDGLPWNASAENTALAKYPHADCSDPANANTWPCKGYGAANCTIMSCIQQINTTVTNGIINEVIEDTIPLEMPFGMGNVSVNGYTLVDRTCALSKNASLAQQLDTGTPVPNKDDWLVFVSVALTKSNTVAPLVGDWITGYDGLAEKNAFDVPVECAYLIDEDTSLSILDYLATFLAGNARPFKSTQMEQLVPAFAFNASAVVNQFFLGGNLTLGTVNNTFNNIARGITRQLRSVPTEPGLSDPAVGVAKRPETCIQVRWHWMAYPAVLAVGVAVFLAVVIIKSTWGDRDTRDWKTSSLPVLFNGLDHRPGSTGVTSAAMKRQAKDMRVVLGQTDRGWRLKDV